MPMLPKAAGEEEILPIRVIFSDRFRRKPGPVSKLALEEEFLIVTIRLKVGLCQKDLACLKQPHLECLHHGCVKCLSYEKAKQFGRFPMARVILGCTEICTGKPSSLQANKAIYSHYKSHNTIKYLVGISPHPAVVYVSRA